MLCFPLVQKIVQMCGIPILVCPYIHRSCICGFTSLQIGWCPPSIPHMHSYVILAEVRNLCSPHLQKGPLSSADVGQALKKHNFWFHRETRNDVWIPFKTLEGLWKPEIEAWVRGESGLQGLAFTPICAFRYSPRLLLVVQNGTPMNKGHIYIS